VSDEDGVKDVEEIQPDAEGKIPAGQDGKFPKVVPASKYIGVKEMLSRKEEAFTKTEQELKDKVSSLEEQLKGATTPGEFNQVKQELENIKTKLTSTETELSTLKDKTLADKREALIKRGIAEDKVKAMGSAELDAAIVAIQGVKQVAPDFVPGGSGNLIPTGNPYTLATQGYSSSNK